MFLKCCGMGCIQYSTLLVSPLSCTVLRLMCRTEPKHRSRSWRHVLAAASADLSAMSLGSKTCAQVSTPKDDRHLSRFMSCTMSGATANNSAAAAQPGTDAVHGQSDYYAVSVIQRMHCLNLHMYLHCCAKSPSEHCCFNRSLLFTHSLRCSIVYTPAPY